MTCCAKPSGASGSSGRLRRRSSTPCFASWSRTASRRRGSCAPTRGRRKRQYERPDKTLYRLTDLGLERLREGLEQVASTVNKNPLELRIFFGEHRPLEAVIADLEGVRDRARAHLAELEEIEQTFDHDEHLFPYLTLLRGKENARADVAGAESALELLRR